MAQAETSQQKSFLQTLHRPIVTLLALQLMSGMLLAPQFTFFPIYVKELGYSAIVIANMAAVKQVAGLIASLVGGTMSDTLGRKKTLVLGNFGFLLSSCVFLFASPKLIGLLWTVGGFGAGLHTLGGQSYLMDTAAAGYLGLTSALYNWGYTLGGALSSPISGAVLDRWDYDIFAWAILSFAIITVAVNQFVLPSSPITCKSQAPRLKSFFGYGDIATRPTVLILTALRFLPTFYYASLLILIPLLLDAGGASKTTIAWYATVSWVAASIAQALVGYIADRWSPNLTTALAFIVLLSSVPGLCLGHNRVLVVFLSGTVGIAAAWSLSTLLPTLVAQVTVPDERGRVLGFIHLFWNLAIIVGSLTGGALFEIAAGLPFLAGGLANLCSLGLLLIFSRFVSNKLDSDLYEQALIRKDS